MTTSLDYDNLSPFFLSFCLALPLSYLLLDSEHLSIVTSAVLNYYYNIFILSPWPWECGIMSSVHGKLVSTKYKY